MPLRDHFHSPIDDTHSWDEVHGGWPMMLVRELFDLLPEGYHAAPNIHLGAPIEIDIATFNQRIDCELTSDSQSHTTATSIEFEPTLTVETDLSEQDEYEVRVYDDRRERLLVAAIEIVSPANKDRVTSRELFVSKLIALLQQGVSVSLIDLVTSRTVNFYRELLQQIGIGFSKSDDLPDLYAVTVRTRQGLSRSEQRNRKLLDAWLYPMKLGEPLPTIPIWLSPTQSICISLESSYEETCRLLRIR